MPLAASPPGALLTVAVPTCNGGTYLAESLRSILAQADLAFELVVSDDRSDDESVELVRATAGDRARIEVNSERLGLAGNWNRCAALARTPFVAIFHQDDVMMPGHLAAHVATLTSDDRLGLVGGAVDVIDDRGVRVPETVVERGGLGSVNRILEPNQLANAMVAGNPLRCSAVTHRIATHADVGGFDPSYRYVVDWDFWLRVSRRWKIAWLARPSVRVRWHPQSETHRFQAGMTDLDETARILEQLYSIDWKDRPDVDQLRNTANARLGRAFLNRAHDALRAGRSGLARDALRSALKRSPALLTTILRQPRLCVQMAALAAAPHLAARLFARVR
jgi:glycosyltransferase involved in cell wall biosynthesis